MVEYVAVHELVRLIEPNHDKHFRKLLSLAMPDYALRKRWVAGDNSGRFILSARRRATS